MDNNETKKKEAKQKYYDSLKFEHELINHRITWLLTSQTILFAAYGLGLEKGEVIFLRTIPWVGLLVSFFILLGIFTSYLAKYYAQKTYREESGDYQEPIGVRTWITFMGFVSEIFLPLIFVIAWVLLISIALFE